MATDETNGDSGSEKRDLLNDSLKLMDKLSSSQGFRDFANSLCGYLTGRGQQDDKVVERVHWMRFGMTVLIALMVCRLAENGIIQGQAVIAILGMIVGHLWSERVYGRVKYKKSQDD